MGTKTVREAEDAVVELPSITETSKSLKISSFETPKLNLLQLPTPVLARPLILYKPCWNIKWWTTIRATAVIIVEGSLPSPTGRDRFCDERAIIIYFQLDEPKKKDYYPKHFLCVFSCV